jgi:carboxymethylenebutenolidase
MTRKSAHDFDQELLTLFDAYVHGDLDRRGFLDRAAKFAVGGLTAAMLLDQLNPRFAEAQQVKPEDERLRGERVDYPSPAGSGTMRGYLVRPAAASGKLPGALVIHENRGLNPHIEDVARRFALAGYLAFAPDALTPLGGYPGEEDAARGLFGKLDAAKTKEDFVAACGWLAGHAESSGRVGAVGFCWGGGMANWLATRGLPGLACAVPFYGSPADAADAPKIRIPLQLHFAEHDPRINAAWPECEAALKAAGVPYEAHHYPGTQHGFHNDTTPRYDAAAAELAWRRTLEFFGKQLGG